MLQFQGVKVLLKLPHMDEVCRELGIIATAFPLDLIDDQLGISYDTLGVCTIKLHLFPVLHM
jgi:hypothetical protein